MIKVIPYILLGFPDIEKSYKAIEEFLADPKIRFIELGMPSKDPFKDGEIIRHFQNDLISKNFYLDDYLNFIADNFEPYEIKKFIPMGYLKDIEEYGIENFNEKVSKIGFTGMICIHDTSESEKLKMLKLPTIPVVSCDSSGSFMKEKFLKKPPFIYFVSGNGKTGETIIHSNDILRKALTMIRKKIPGIPVYAGFGIDSHEKAKKMIDIGFDGIIVGSALLNSLEEGITASEFLENLRGKKMKNLLFDFGTTAIKLTLINSDYSECSSISKKLETNITGKRITQSTSEWKKNFFDALKELLSSTKTKNIKYIIGTGQMEDLILIDKNNVVEENATLYSDSFIEGKIPDSEIKKYERESPNSVDNFTPLMKLLSRIDKDKNYLCDTKKIIFGAKDLINYFLTGFSFTDYTNASTTGLFSTENNCWNNSLPEEILNKLPKIEEPTFKIGFMKKEIAEELGLDNIPQVVNGIGDAGASTLGSEIEKCGESYIYLGTTGWIAHLQENFSKSEDFFLLSGPFKNQWQKMGPLLNAGNVFDWAMKNFLNTENYGTVNDVIKNNRNTGVLSWPYLNGERSPKNNPDVRGVISGISQDVTSEELFTSFVRSIAFSLRLVSEKMVIQGIGSFKLIGGLTGSPAWCQLLADIMNKNIVVPSSGQSGPQFGLTKLLQKIIKTKSTKSNEYITYVPSGRNYDGLYREYKEFAEDLLGNRTSCPSYLR